MNANTQPIGVGDLPCNIIVATCCAECPEPPCVRACPRGIDVQSALKTLLVSHPLAARMLAIKGTKDFEGAMD